MVVQDQENSRDRAIAAQRLDCRLAGFNAVGNTRNLLSAHEQGASLNKIAHVCFGGRSMHGFRLLATTVAILCLVSPVVARMVEGENPSMLSRVNLPQWPAQSLVKSVYRGVPKIALLSNELIPPQPENMALRRPNAISTIVPLLSGEPRANSAAKTLKTKAETVASSRHVSPQKPLSAHRKSAQLAPPKSGDVVFMGGLY